MHFLKICLICCTLTLQVMAAPLTDPAVPGPVESPRVLQLTRQMTSQLSDQLSQAKDQAGDQATQLITRAMDLLGVPYKRGGTTETTGFDCSGFVRHLYEKSVGQLLPRRAEEQARATDIIKPDELKPGDLVFFNTMRRAFSHVGIYMGDGKFIHSPRAGKSVKVEDMREAYWQKRFNGARRVPTNVDNTPP
jgi:cell wall-associated NlpC family hydrolase